MQRTVAPPEDREVRNLSISRRNPVGRRHVLATTVMVTLTMLLSSGCWVSFWSVAYETGPSLGPTSGIESANRLDLRGEVGIPVLMCVVAWPADPNFEPRFDAPNPEWGEINFDFGDGTTALQSVRTNQQWGCALHTYEQAGTFSGSAWVDPGVNKLELVVEISDSNRLQVTPTANPLVWTLDASRYEPGYTIVDLNGPEPAFALDDVYWYSQRVTPFGPGSLRQDFTFPGPGTYRIRAQVSGSLAVRQFAWNGADGLSTVLDYVARVDETIVIP